MTEKASHGHMNLMLILAAWGAVNAVPAQANPFPPPDPIEQQKVLADVAAFAANHEANLPNFVCLQTTRRFEDLNGKGWNPIDTIVERLAYLNHREVYQVMTRNGNPVNISHDNLRGASSSGEFGSMMSAIFAHDTSARFEWHDWTTLRGVRMYVYAYEVSVARSAYHIELPDRSLDLVTPYHGLIFVDAERHVVHRITLHVDEIPPNFPMQDIALILDYDYTRINDTDYLLPLQFELRSRHGKRLIKNEVTYGDYRKFSAVSVIVFDQPEATRR